MKIINTALCAGVSKAIRLDDQWYIEVEARVIENPALHCYPKPTHEVWLNMSRYDNPKIRILCRRKDACDIPKEKLSTANILQWFVALNKEDEELLSGLEQDAINAISLLLNETVLYFNERLSCLHGNMEILESFTSN